MESGEPPPLKKDGAWDSLPYPTPPSYGSVEILCNAKPANRKEDAGVVVVVVN